MNEIRIATRQSPLALWQAEEVARLLKAQYPTLTITLVKMTTQGDELLDKNLNAFGGKGLFVKELEKSLLDDRADIAVHSMKDVPIQLPEGLHLPVILQREDPADAFVSNQFNSITDLPDGSIVGTSSLRRQAQLRAAFPHLVIRDLRGNVGTRLGKLDGGQYDAIILAVAGLKRLELSARIKESLPFDISLPAIGQGAVGIECRQNDSAIETLIAPLAHAKTQTCVNAERALNITLSGGCHAPVAGHAIWLDESHIELTGLVGSPNGDIILRKTMNGAAETADTLGVALGKHLLAQGADTILQDAMPS